MLTRESVLHISKLANLRLSEDEINRLTPQLSEILDYFNKLNGVDTSGIEPNQSPQKVEKNRFQMGETNDQQLPSKDGYFKTKAVL